MSASVGRSFQIRTMISVARQRWRVRRKDVSRGAENSLVFRTLCSIRVNSVSCANESPRECFSLWVVSFKSWQQVVSGLFLFPSLLFFLFTHKKGEFFKSFPPFLFFTQIEVLIRKCIFLNFLQAIIFFSRREKKSQEKCHLKNKTRVRMFWKSCYRIKRLQWCFQP